MKVFTLTVFYVMGKALTGTFSGPDENIEYDRIIVFEFQMNGYTDCK